MSSPSEPLEVNFTRRDPADVPLVAPTVTVTLDPEYSGQWVVLGDLD
jgi:hypothetical protein